MKLNDFMAQQTTVQDTMPEKPTVQTQPETSIPEGQRNTTLSHTAGRLVKRYGNTPEAREKFSETAATCDPPLSQKELDGIWKSAVKFGKKVSAQDGYIPPEQYNDPTPRKPTDYSDVGQAYAFAKFCRGYVRYSPATDYLVYDGISWQESKPRAQAALHEFTDASLRRLKSTSGIPRRTWTTPGHRT